MWGRRGGGTFDVSKLEGSEGNRAEKDVRCEGGPLFCLEVMGSAIFNSLFSQEGGRRNIPPLKRCKLCIFCTLVTCSPDVCI